MFPTLPALTLPALLLPQAPIPEGGGSAAAELRLEASIELPGVGGRIDHLALHPRRRRLFVAARGNDSLEVLDLERGERVRSVAGISEPQGVLVLEEEDLVLVSSGGTGRLEAFRAGSLEPVAEVEVGRDADNLRRDPRTGLVYAGCGDGELTVVDPRTWKVSARIGLDGHPEAFAFDPTGERIFVNVPASSSVEVVDVALRKVVASWRLREETGNFPMAVQTTDRRVVLGCREPPRLLVLDSLDGHTIDEIPTCGDADDVYLVDAGGRGFVSCGAGSIDVLRLDGSGRYRSRERIPTAPGARTCLVTPDGGKLFLAVPRRAEAPAEIRVYEVRR